jgi:hypothetical protein
MKHLSLQTQKRTVVLLLLSACLLPSWSLRAQDQEKRIIERRKDGKTRIRVEQEKNGRKQVYERTYDSHERPDQVNRSFSWSFPDSLEKEWGLSLDADRLKAFDPPTRFSLDWSTDSLPNKKRSFYFNRSDSDSLLASLRGVFKHYDTNDDFTYSFRMPDNRDFSFRVHPFPPGFSFDNFPGKDRLEFNEEDYELKEQRTDRGRKYIITRKNHPRHRPGSADKNTSSVKNLKVTSGTAGLIDVGFYLPTKGDAEIRVTDIQGKEVFREKLKEAEGSYSRQINLGKKPSGTYFVTVTQHKDGQALRVKIP